MNLQRIALIRVFAVLSILAWTDACREDRHSRGLTVIMIQPEPCHEAASANNQVQDSSLGEQDLPSWVVSPHALIKGYVRVNSSGGDATAIDLWAGSADAIVTLSQTLTVSSRGSGKWCVGAKIKRGDAAQRVSFGVVLSCLEGRSCKGGWPSHGTKDAWKEPGEWEWVGGVIDANGAESLSVFLMVSGLGGSVSVENIVAAPFK